MVQTSFRLDPGDEWLHSNLASWWLAYLATIGPAGPHVTPVAFVWVHQAVWISSQIHTQRFVDLQRDPRVAMVIDPMGADPTTRYVDIQGDATVVGQVPFLAPQTPEIDEVEQRLAEKSGFPREVQYDGLHAWVRVAPRKILRITSVIAHHNEAEHFAAGMARAEKAHPTTPTDQG